MSNNDNAPRLVNRFTMEQMNEFIEYVRDLIEDDDKSKIDFVKLNIEDIYYSICSAMDRLVYCYNDEYYNPKFPGNFENDIDLLKSEIFSEFVNRLSQDDDLSEYSWIRSQAKLEIILGIRDLDMSMDKRTGIW